MFYEEGTRILFHLDFGPDDPQSPWVSNLKSNETSSYMQSQPLQADRSDEQLWPADSTQERTFWEEAAKLDVVDVEVNADEASAPSSTSVTPDTPGTKDNTIPPTQGLLSHSENFLHAIDLVNTHDLPLKLTASTSGVRFAKQERPSSHHAPSPLRLHASSDDVLWKDFPSDELDADEDDAQIVEAMISEPENDVEEPEPARTTQETSDSSRTYSRTTSMTSMTSLSTSESMNSRKRMLNEMDPCTDQPCPTTPSKARRTSTGTRTFIYTRSISHETGHVSKIAPLLVAPVAGPSITAPPAKPTVVHAPKHPKCGWEACDHHTSDDLSVLEGPTEFDSTTKPCRDAEPVGDAEPSYKEESGRKPRPGRPGHKTRPSHEAELIPEAGPSREIETDGVEVRRINMIAHDGRVQELMDTYGIAWGVQYEIARGVTNGRWTWDSISEDTIRDLQGINQEAAHRVSYVLKGKKGKEPAGSSLWAELDREEAAIIECRHRGLGLQGEWHGEQSWYGGKIQQIARLEEPDSDGDAPRIVLERMQMTRSHRFGRFVGSRRLLQLKLPKNSGPQFRHLLEHKFVLCGRVFVSLPDKDGKSYLLEVNEDHERPKALPGDGHRMSLDEFVTWHNPMQFNKNQPVTKWATRFDLGLSTSIPALQFEPENIIIIEDIHAGRSGEHVSTEQILTDGCGLINGSALVAISKNLGYSDRPTAIQGRIYGSKGLWLLHPTDVSADEPPRIWIRHSQVKIKFGPPSDRAISGLSSAHYIFDLVAPSHITSPTRLSRHTIINLAHNGVPASVFSDLMRAGLEAELAPLMNWEGPNAMALLWHSIDKATNAIAGLTQEFASGLQRALGISRKRDSDYEEDDKNSDGDGLSSSRYLPGGKPVSRGELCLRMLQVGFSPRDEPFLYDELRKLIRGKLDKDVKGCHIPIFSSAEAFIAADPLGVLNEGEIAFTSSKPIKDLDAEDRYTIIGDVLIYRNPARLPSDVQKVKAIYHRDLTKYTDVILVPTKGSRSLASLLAGGDLDGDTAICIYEPSLVVPFKAPRTTTQSPGLTDNFDPEGDILRVDAALETLSRSSPSQSNLILQKCLLSGLSDSKVGLYSRFHEAAIYIYGYDHPRTIRIADLFNALLDSRKTGLRLKDGVFESDSRQYGSYDLPDCLTEVEPSELQPRNPMRRRVRKPFILDELLAAGKKLLDELLVRYDKLRKPEDVRHEYLVEPYTNAASLPELSSELRVVESSVRELFERWRKIQDDVDAQMKSSAGRKFKKGSKMDNGKKARLNITKQLAADFSNGPPEGDTKKLRKMGLLDTVSASYAYSLRPIFAFNMAFRPLCAVKARNRDPIVFTQDFAAWMSMRPSAVRILSQGASQSNGDDDYQWYYSSTAFLP